MYTQVCLSIKIISLICINYFRKFKGLFKGVEELHPIITKLIKQLNPDLILMDLIITLPTATNLGIPFVNVLSGGL